MEISYLVVMVLPLFINAIQVPSLSTGTRKLDNREDGSTTTESTANTENQEFPVAGHRCFNWQSCLEPNCTRQIHDDHTRKHNDPVPLDVLKEECFNDDGCIAVSCEDKVGDEECSRSMFSDSCDTTTIDQENNWTIHLLKPTNTGIFRYVQTGTCESNGMTSIRDAIACSYAAAEFERSSTDVIVRAGTFGPPSGRPTGCSWHNTGNLELWLYNTGECNVNGYAGCFCLLNDFA